MEFLSGLLGGGGGGIGAGLGAMQGMMQQSLQTQMQMNMLQMQYDQEKEKLDMMSNIENSKHQALSAVAEKLGQA
jgi:hypothetical protein